MENAVGNAVIPLHRNDLQKRMDSCPTGNSQQNVIGVLAAVEHVHAVKIKIHNVNLRVVLPQIVPFENTPENAREILANLGKNIDVVGGIFDETMLHLRGCAGLELVRDPFHCAVSIHHRLAAKDKLQITDLYGENLMLMHRGWSHYVDQLRDDLWQHHPQIHIVDFDFYNMDVFNRCENTNDVLLAIPGWATVHPLLKIIPVEWNYSIPYGILHSPEPTPTVQRFLDAAKIISKELYS